MTNSKAMEKGSTQGGEINRNVPLKEVLKNLLEKYFGKRAESTSESRTDSVEKNKTQDEETNVYSPPGELWKRTLLNKYFVETTNSTVQSKTGTSTDDWSLTSYSSKDSSCIDFNLEINNNHPSLQRVTLHDEISTISGSDRYRNLSTIEETRRESASNSWINYSFLSSSACSNRKETSSSESDSTSCFQSASNIDFTDFSVDIEEGRQTFSPSWSRFAPLGMEDQHRQSLNNPCNRSREKDKTPKKRGKYKRRSRSLPRERSSAELNFVKANDHSDDSDVKGSSRLLFPQQHIRRSSSCIIMSSIKPVKQLKDYYTQLEKKSERELIILEPMIRRRRPPVPFITITNATPKRI